MVNQWLDEIRGLFAAALYWVGACSRKARKRIMGKGEYLGEFEQLVLLALATLGADAPGRDVYEEITRTTGRDVAVTAVYVTLSRLHKKGYVSAAMGEATPERGGRAKKLFRLEPEGAEALKRAREQLDVLWRAAKSHPELRG
jgi:DNA-binding PadR family transcriptional regulator